MASHKSSQSASHPGIQHVAIIMDGNGRWAQNRGRPRIFGHREGAIRVDEIVTETTALGIPFLTLYAFSTENWGRPRREVGLLMRLLAQHLCTMDKKLIKNRVRLIAQGSLDRLPKFARQELARVMELTRFEAPNLTLNLSLSYGGRQEIVDAAKAFARECVSGQADLETMDVEQFRRYLYQPGVPDPDLLIRTGGEYRVSNFLLWQIAYSELYTTSCLWPDFRIEQYHEALEQFEGRRRRFGKTDAQIGEALAQSPVTESPAR